jgi:hypothetical protein
MLLAIAILFALAYPSKPTNLKHSALQGLEVPLRGTSKLLHTIALNRERSQLGSDR